MPLRSKLLAAALVCAACIAGAFAYYLSRDASVPLFAEPLGAEQVSEVVERLAAWNVPFVAVSDNVRVAPRIRNELLLRLSVAGVPHAHVPTSAEALAKAGPLTPQSVLDAQQRAGLAGDLELALRGVAGIEDARVILAVERPALFGDESPRPASASVRLTLRPGAALSRETLAGLRSFVAAAVSGLDPHRVTLLDDRGVTLGDGAGTTGQASDLEASLQSALDAAFGAGATIVRVRVGYDARSHEVREARREPFGAGAIRTVRTDERYANDKKHYVKANVDEDRGSALHEERTAVTAGAMERISVAVLVDAARKLDVAKIRAVAAATVGLVPSRGDAISVESIVFRKAPPVVVAGRDVALGYVASFAPLVLVTTAMLVALRLTWRPLLDCVVKVTATRAAPRMQITSGSPPSSVRAALAHEPPHTVAAVLSGLPSPTAAAVLETYAPEERRAIVECMSRGLPAVARDAHALLRQV